MESVMDTPKCDFVCRCFDCPHLIEDGGTDFTWYCDYHEEDCVNVEKCELLANEEKGNMK